MGFLREPAVWIVILVVILLFGAKRLPDLARGVGRSLRIFKAETEGLRSDGSPADAPTATPQVTSAPAAPAPAPAVTADPATPATPAGPRYLVDPVTGEKVLAQPVTPPSDGTPRA
jgi:sec-independent protein translocase protein TatA